MSAESFEAAVAAREAGRLQEAARAARRAVKGFTTTEGARAPDTAHARLELGRILVALGEDEGVHQLVAATRTLLAIRGGDADVVTLTVHACLVTAAALRAAGKYPLAERFAAQALARATEPSWIAAAHNELGVIGKFTGQYVEAQRHYRAVRPIVRRLYGERSVQMAALLHNLGGLAHARARYEEGERYARQSVEIGRAVLPRGSLEQHAHEVAYGALLDGLGRYREAQGLYRRALAAYREAGDRYEVASTLHSLATSQHTAGWREGARKSYLAALREYRASVGSAHPDVGLTQHNLATLEREMGRTARAVQLWDRAIANLEAALGRFHPTTEAACNAHAEAVTDARSRSRRPRGARYTR